MRKLRLEQPFASMVICGALQTIPDKWGNVKVGEKILIYAGEISTEYLRSPLDMGSELDRKYLNEIFFGNISDTEYRVNEYLGYVKITSKGKTTEGWPIGIDKVLYVCKPYEFELEVDNYNEDILKLDSIPAHSFPRKTMERKGDVLIVPVGESGWNEVRDSETFESTWVFWENYMNDIIPLPWSDLSCEIDEISEVHFVFNKHEIIFNTDYSVGYNLGQYEKDGKKEIVAVFDFNLNCLSDFSKEGFIVKEQKGRINTSKQWTKIIYTPMGGMTKWKRR